MAKEHLKKVFIRTYGCQMNVYDSERMGDILDRAGFGPTGRAEDADLIILNTCHIREKASEKVFSELGRIRKLKESRSRKGLSTTVVVAGCVAQAEGDEIVKRASLVDLVLGPQTYHRLPELLAQRQSEGQPVVATEFPAEDKFERLGSVNRARAVSAFVTVQEGCDKFCTFCVVPYTRGAEFSRPVGQIGAEVRKLAAAGVREITLLGQNVNAYHGASEQGDSWSLARLITYLSQIEGIERIRYTTSHPREMTDDLIAVHAENPKLMPYLHLPVQAGSDRVLKAMNRGHSTGDYLRLVDRIRAARPDIALSGDFIVGFPGETEADFQDTLMLVGELKYASAFSFKYSPRPGTPAADREDQVAEEVKANRLERLQELLGRQMHEFNSNCVGRSLPVLLEKPGRLPGQVAGRSPYLQPVHVDAAAGRIGDIVTVTIDGVGVNSLSAHTCLAA